MSMSMSKELKMGDEVISVEGNVFRFIVEDTSSSEYDVILLNKENRIIYATWSLLYEMEIAR